MIYIVPIYIIVHYSLQVQEVWLCLPRPLPHPHALQLWPENNQLPSIRTQEGTLAHTDTVEGWRIALMM